jgi:hypothetical protein
MSEGELKKRIESKTHTKFPYTILTKTKEEMSERLWASDEYGGQISLKDLGETLDEAKQEFWSFFKQFVSDDWMYYSDLEELIKKWFGSEE